MPSPHTDHSICANDSAEQPLGLQSLCMREKTPQLLCNVMKIDMSGFISRRAKDTEAALCATFPQNNSMFAKMIH